MIKLLLFTFFGLLFTSAAFAQDEIDTDRPDQTEATSIVPAGRFQMENGFTYQKIGPGSKSITIPESLWKFGINKNLELRVITIVDHQKSPDSVTTGLQPLTVGLKVKLWEEKGAVPETSLITHVQLPKVASKEYQAKYLAPEIRLLFNNTLTEKIGLGYNLGMEWDGETNQPQFAYTFSPDMELTDKLKCYIESFGFLPEKRHGDHWVDGGFMYLISKDIQIDISAGYELTSMNHYHQYYEALGFSFRI